MRPKALALCARAGFASSAAAQDSTQTLHHASKQIPESILSTPDAMQVFFVDVQAWRELEKSGPSADGMRRLAMAAWIRLTGSCALPCREAFLLLCNRPVRTV